MKLRVPLCIQIQQNGSSAPAAPEPAVPATLVLSLDPVSALLACRLVELTRSTPVVVATLEEALGWIPTMLAAS